MRIKSVKTFCVVLLTNCFLFSCRPVLKAVKGITDPKLETYTKTKKYLFKNDIDSSRTVYYKDVYAFELAIKKKYGQVPNAFFFDKKGSFVDYRKTATDCNAKVDDFIQDLNAFNEVKKDSTRTMAELKSFLTSSNENLLSEKPGDITVFITWARYAGALNKEKAFDWVKLLKEAQQNGINVNYYLLNCDFQENWNLTNEQKKVLGLKI